MLIEILEMYSCCCNDCDTIITMCKKRSVAQVAMIVNVCMLEESDIHSVIKYLSKVVFLAIAMWFLSRMIC